MTYISLVLNTLAIREGEDMIRERDHGDFMENIKHQCIHQIERLYSGTSEIRTPRDLAKVSLFRRCP